jgi:hypothetical protein
MSVPRLMRAKRFKCCPDCRKILTDALRRNTTVFLRRNGSRFSGFTVRDREPSAFVSIEYDHLVQAQAAMRLAATATCDRERLEWVRIALAWHDLAAACATPPRTESADENAIKNRPLSTTSPLRVA